MKWTGQHIIDLIARLRSDVYLEDLSTTTETNVLVVDSNGLVSKSTSVSGDLTAIVAGDGMTGSDLSGPIPTLNVIAGTGIDVTADAVAVDVSDFMSSGADNYVLTATGADAMQAEPYLTFENTGNVSTLSWLSNQDTGDLFRIATTTHGATIITTIDDDAAAADLTLKADGQIKIDPAAANNILLDGVLTVDAGVVVPVATDHSLVGTSISFGAGSTTAGTTNNIAGGSLVLHGGQGKGTGAGGDILFKTANAGVSGSSLNALATALTISDDRSATFAGDVTCSGILTFDSVALEGIQTSSESFVDDNISIMTSAAIEDKILAYGYSTTTGDITSVIGGTNINVSGGTIGDATVNLDNPIAGPIEIEQGASGGAPALLIDNDTVDRHALKLEAANTTSNALQIAVPDLTTGNAIKVNADSLTTGSAIDLDIDDPASLTTSATKSLIDVNYAKAGDTASGQTSITTGLNVLMQDTADGNVGNIYMTGLKITIDSTNANGNVAHIGSQVSCSDGDAATTYGYISSIVDGGYDFWAYSSTDSADFFHIATTENGQTTLTTVDGDGSNHLGHFEIAADGNIILDARQGIILEAANGVIQFDGNEANFSSANAAFLSVTASDSVTTGSTVITDDSIVMTPSTDDTFTIAAATNGATTLTTVDTAATAAHFEVAADGDITLDAAGDIALECGDGELTCDADTITFTSADSYDPTVRIKNTTNDASPARLQFIKDKGAAGADSDDVGLIDFIGDNSDQSQVTFGKILAEVSDATQGMEGGKLTLGVASHDGEVTEGIIIDGSSSFTDATCDYNNDPTIEMDSNALLIAGMSVSGTGIPAGAFVLSVHANGTEFELSASTTGGSVTNGTLTFGNIEDEVDVTIGNGTGSVVTIPGQLLAHNGGMGTKHYGEKIKILPSDFITDTGGGNTKHGVGFIGTAGNTTYGVKVPNSGTNLWAFVSIPEGMKATHINIFDKNNTAFEVFEVQINDHTAVSKGTGNCNTKQAITNVESTLYNSLAIEVDITTVNDRIRGGLVTIIPI